MSHLFILVLLLKLIAFLKQWGGDPSEQQDPAGTNDDESEGPPALAESDSDGEDEVDEEDVPKVRSRP